MEIGAAAISFLIDTWEGHLTPPEAASIADRASRGCDPNMVRAAAELALSCLPHAHALNPNEITRAILQCKEQSDIMLEHACLTVESAAKGGGVYPEVLFQVAKYWYELYVFHTPGGEQLIENDLPHDSLLDPHGALVALIEPNPEMQLPPGLPGQNGTPVITNSGPVVVTTAPPPPYQHPAVTTLAPLGMSMPYAVGPYGFTVQGLSFSTNQHRVHIKYAGIHANFPIRSASASCQLRGPYTPSRCPTTPATAAAAAAARSDVSLAAAIPISTAYDQPTAVVREHPAASAADATGVRVPSPSERSTAIPDVGATAQRRCPDAVLRRGRDHRSIV